MLHSSVGEERSGIATGYAASAGANSFAPTNPSTDDILVYRKFPDFLIHIRRVGIKLGLGHKESPI
jgi:hypothetical protein